MPIRILMEALRIEVVALKRIQPVEPAIAWVVVASTEVVVLEIGIKLLAGIQQRSR